MEITLEKIELVKDRTGVSYKEAKEALEKTDGNVVDAIINIEESINMDSRSKVGAQSSQILDKLKELVKKGNVSKIVISRDGEQILNLPVNVGIVGTVLAPWAAVIGVIAAFGTRCIIEVVTDSGEVINVSEKANVAFEDVKDKSADFVDGVREKGAEVFDSVKNRAQSRGRKQEDQSQGDSDASETAEDAEGYVSTSADETNVSAEDSQNNYRRRKSE